MTPLYMEFARSLEARGNCLRDGRLDWVKNWGRRLDWLCKEALPSGSGVDCGVTLDHDKSKSQRLVFNLSFHHMDEYGSYDGWTEHTAIVTPCLAHGFALRITGRDRRDIKSYLADIMGAALSAERPEVPKDI